MLMALITSAPRLCDAITMARDLHLEYPEADWNGLQYFWKSLCAFSYWLVDLSIDGICIRIVYTMAFGLCGQRLSQMKSRLKAALLLTAISSPPPIMVRTGAMFAFLNLIPYDLRPCYALAMLLVALCFFKPCSFCRGK